MNKNILVIGIIFLFFGAGVYPVFAVEPISSFYIENKENELDINLDFSDYEIKTTSTIGYASEFNEHSESKKPNNLVDPTTYMKSINLGDNP